MSVIGSLYGSLLPAETLVLTVTFFSRENLLHESCTDESLDWPPITHLVWGLLEKLKQRRKFGVDDLFLLGKREKGMRTDVVTTPVTIELPLYAKERRVSKLWVEEIERPSVLTSEKFCRNVNGEGLWCNLLLDDGLD